MLTWSPIPVLEMQLRLGRRHSERRKINTWRASGHHRRGGKGRPRAGGTKVRKQSIRPRWPFCDRAGTGNPLAINSHSRSPKPHACTCEDADQVQLLPGEPRRVGGQGGKGVDTCHVCCVFPDTLAAGADWASCDLTLKESGRLQMQIYISEEAVGVRARC